MDSQSTAEVLTRAGRGEGLLIRPVQFSIDVAVLALALGITMASRNDFVPSGALAASIAWYSLVFVPVQFSSLLLAGVYSIIWHYIGLQEIRRFANAAIGSAVALVIVQLLLARVAHELSLDPMVVLVDTLLAWTILLGVRVVRRVFYDRALIQRTSLRTSAGKPRRRVLLIGAGRTGLLTAAEIRKSCNDELQIVGFLDDDGDKRGSVIGGVKVLGAIDGLADIARKHGVEDVIITIAGARRDQFRRILAACEGAGVRVRVVPALDDMVSGRTKISRIRDLQIGDLLGREAIELDQTLMSSFLQSKTVMVTGAGGSIGAELARQIAFFKPRRLLLVERVESPLLNIDSDLGSSYPGVQRTPLVVDVGDESMMRSIFARYRPDVVFHAAAHKHVPMMESNCAEAIRNNVLATYVLGRLAGEYGTTACVLTSTDKAVQPTSFMGASKRLAELVMQALNQRYDTRFVAVRFGNVIGSAGSVVPIFLDQIRKGKPLTVTHPEMTRYVMTAQEASQLVIQAGAMGAGGEIFVLDMGEPVRILDLAKEVITLCGLQPFEDVQIVFSGIRPGEKLYEELGGMEDDLSKTRHPRIFIGRITSIPFDEIETALLTLDGMVHDGDDQELRRFVAGMSPDASIDC